MRNTFFALAVVALHIISIHSLQAQCVTFTHNEHKGFQNNVEEPYVNFTGLTYNYPAADGNKSDWLKDGNTVSYSGELSTNSEDPTMAIQHYNHGTWYGVLTDCVCHKNRERNRRIVAIVKTCE